MIAALYIFILAKLRTLSDILISGYGCGLYNVLNFSVTKKIVLSTVGLYGYGNAARAASQAWHAMDDEGLGARGQGFKPWENPPFVGVSYMR